MAGRNPREMASGLNITASRIWTALDGFEVLVATLCMTAATAAFDQNSAERGSIPPGQSKDGAGPADSTIKGGSILPGEQSSKSDKAKAQARAATELLGTLREDCLERERSGATGGRREPDASGYFERVRRNERTEQREGHQRARSRCAPRCSAARALLPPARAAAPGVGTGGPGSRSVLAREIKLVQSIARRRTGQRPLHVLGGLANATSSGVGVRGCSCALSALNRERKTTRCIGSLSILDHLGRPVRERFRCQRAPTAPGRAHHRRPRSRDR